VGALAVLSALLLTLAWGLGENWSPLLDGLLAAGLLVTSGLHVYLLAGGRHGPRVARALAKRGWRTFLSYKFQLIMVFVQIGLFIAVIYLLGAPLVDALFRPVGEAMARYTQTNYVVFLLLGIAAWPLLWGVYEVSAGRLRQEQMTGMFESLVPTAAGVESLPFAYLLSRLGMSVVTLTATLLVFAYLLPEGAITLSSPLSVLAFATVIALAIVTMWGLGLIMTGLTALFKQAGAASSLLRFLLIAFAGIYVPVELLPGWAAPLSEALPLTHAFRAVREILGHGATLVDVLPEVAALALFALYSSFGGMWVFRKLLDRARRAGTLYGY